VLCTEKERLWQDYANAASECNRIQSAQVAVLKRGEDFTLEEALEQASRRREKAKAAILRHVEKHGC
jgi:hypothetical protein